MPTYFFDFHHSSNVHRDDVGTELPHESAAHDHMRRALIEVFRDSETVVGESLTILVRDAKGRIASGRIELRIQPESSSEPCPV